MDNTHQKQAGQTLTYQEQAPMVGISRVVDSRATVADKSEIRQLVDSIEEGLSMLGDELYQLVEKLAPVIGAVPKEDTEPPMYGGSCPLSTDLASQEVRLRRAIAEVRNLRIRLRV